MSNSPPTPDRAKLPDRRNGVRVPLTCTWSGNEFAFDAQFNFYDDGRLGELFARPFKTGAHMEGLLDLFCKSISWLLQRGDRIEHIWNGMDDGTPPDDRNIFQALIFGGVQAEQRRILQLAKAGNSPPDWAVKP